jgi:hypothetical protein
MVQGRTKILFQVLDASFRYLWRIISFKEERRPGQLHKRSKRFSETLGNDFFSRPQNRKHILSMW